MLHFWKKSGSKDSARSGPPSPVQNVSSHTSPSLSNGDSTCLGSSDAHNSLLARLEEEESEPAQTEDNESSLLNYRSRLCMSLAEVIADKSALGYFIQYLEAKSAGSLIRFWLDVESFHSAAQEEARTIIANSPTGPNNLSRNCGTKICDYRQTTTKSKENGPTETKDCLERTRTSASVCSDALRIFDKYLGLNATHPVPVDDNVRNSIALAVCSNDNIEPDSFSAAQNICYNVMEKDHFNEFLRSDFYCKHQIDVLTSGNVGLPDILYNQPSLFYFMEFMEQEGHHSLLEFWLAANNFSAHLIENKDKVDLEQAQSDAIILYDKYFSLQATCPLGFSDKLRVEMEHNICCEGGPKPTCFSKPLNIVIKLLQMNYLQPFLQSQLYFKYLSELVNTIQATKAGSECGSDGGSNNAITSSSSSLSAPGDPTPPKKILRNVEQQNLSIDSRQLYDPDSLWRRRHPSGLSFGRINSLGRFETEVEPEPDKRSGSRLTRAMKKLVHLDEDKTKEEMAWQIAEMIVKDVTSVTLTDSSSS